MASAGGRITAGVGANLIGQHAHDRNQEATCYVGNLDDKVNEDLLWELFTQAGPVNNIYIPMDRVTNKHRGHAFVEFKGEDDADYAIKVLNMIKVFGKPVRVNKASQDKKATDVGANLFVGNLDPDVDEKILYDTFSAFGVIVATPKIMRDPETGVSKGFGFVSFDNFESSDAAVEAMHGQFLMNRAISVQYAFKKDSTERHGTPAERLMAQNYRLAAMQRSRPHTLFATAPSQKPTEGQGPPDSLPFPPAPMAPPPLAPAPVPPAAPAPGPAPIPVQMPGPGHAPARGPAPVPMPAPMPPPAPVPGGVPAGVQAQMLPLSLPMQTGGGVSWQGQHGMQAPASAPPPAPMPAPAPRGPPQPAPVSAPAPGWGQLPQPSAPPGFRPPMGTSMPPGAGPVPMSAAPPWMPQPGGAPRGPGGAPMGMPMGGMPGQLGMARPGMGGPPMEMLRPLPPGMPPPPMGFPGFPVMGPPRPGMMPMPGRPYPAPAGGPR